MTQEMFFDEFQKLGAGCKTKDVDRLNKRLIREKLDVSFLKPLVCTHDEYFRTYFQVSLAYRKTASEKLAFIEDNFELLRDWWHVDILIPFFGNSLDFELALEKSKEYTQSRLPYVRRLGYVLFIPRLVKDAERNKRLYPLFKNDAEYHVVMAEAWLLSYLAMCDWAQAYEYLKNCGLSYDIVGRAIQKICDSYVVSGDVKERFKGLRSERKRG